MVSIRSLASLAFAIIGLVSAAPALKEARQSYQNTTQEFYIKLSVTHGSHKYNGWYLETYHTGAGLADPVFTNTTVSPAFLNGTQLQFDVGGTYPFSAVASPGDTNYARWEFVIIEIGYGVGDFVIEGKEGIQVDSEEFGGWLVCEWWHAVNAPQLFQLITGFDTDPDDIPSTCSRALLIPEYF